MRLKRSLTISAIAMAAVLAVSGCTDSGAPDDDATAPARSEEHTSELQSQR